MENLSAEVILTAEFGMSMANWKNNYLNIYDASAAPETLLGANYF